MLYPFRRANLLINLRLLTWFDSLLELKEKNSDNQIDANNSLSNWVIINKSYYEIRKILEDLGKIELAISAEWLLASNQRIFKVHPHNSSIKGGKKQ